MDILKNWNVVFNENGEILKNGNSIVLQHASSDEIGYLEDTPLIREILKLPLQSPQCNERDSPLYFLGDEDVLMDKTQNLPTLHNSDNNENYQIEYCSGMSTSTSSETNPNKIKWTARNTRLLINTRLSNEKEFSRPKCKKIKLWQNIANKINKELDKGNYQPVTAEECDNKFRNLLKTYKANKKKQKSTGEGAITWEYFEAFDEILGCKASIEPPENTLVDTMDKEYDTESDLPTQIEQENINENAENININENASDPSTSSTGTLIGKSSGKAKKKVFGKNSLQFKEYLYLKNKREEERDKKKQLFEQERWNEEKELRKEETSAILKLVEAIASSKE